MFDADRPIQRSDQDLLNRNDFAKYLARSLLDQKNKDSFTLGLYGDFGSGKTSLINLMLEELRFAASNLFDHEKPIILNFSPWSYSGQKQLVYHFFRRLSSELRQAPYLENAERIITLLELYISFFTREVVPKKLRFRLPKKLIKRKPLIGWESGQDLTHVKAELNDLLLKQQHKIIIIIDNIEKILPEEIQQLFQIIKSMGDFSNTVYLLSMNKKLVTDLLKKQYKKNTDSMLEKLIQLPFTVPPISRQDLDYLLMKKLNVVAAQLPEEAFDTRYWEDCYFGTLTYFFNEIRDVTHYINSVYFSFARVKDLVNPVDYFAMTALQLFEPAFYEGIRDNKDLFTDLMTHVYAVNKERLLEDKIRCDAIFKRIQHIRLEDLLPLMLRLFPKLRSLYQPETGFYYSEALARKNLRICSPDIFDLYFKLSLGTSDITSHELKTLFAFTKNADAMTELLTRFIQDGRIQKLFSAFDRHLIRELPKSHIPFLIESLLDCGDLIPSLTKTRLTQSTPDRIHRLIHHLLQQLNTSDERFGVLYEGIKKSTKSLYILIHEIEEQAKEHLESEDTFLPLEYRDITPEQLDTLRQLAVSKIQYWVDHGNLINHPKLMSILIAWKKWGDEKACLGYIESITQTDRGLVKFLEATLERPISEAISTLEKKADWKNDLINITAFIPTKTLEAHAIELFEDPYFEKLSEREQLALLIFLDLIHAKTLKTIPKTSA